MTSNDFLDQLERELRVASRRRVRLELARVPRVPAGVGVLVVAAVIAAAVAVPVLATRSGSPTSQPAGGGTSGSGAIVFGCHDAVSGLVPAGSTPGGTVTTGPIAWGFLRKEATHAAVYGRHFVSATALVGTGRNASVTVSIPPAERQAVALDYGIGLGQRSRFRLSQGVSSVTFVPCRVGGQSQFPGGFIVTRAQCAEIVVEPNGPSVPKHYFLPLGRSCGVAPSGAETVPVPLPTGPPEKVLKGDGIGRAAFKEEPRSVIHKLDRLLGERPTRRRFGRGQCGIDGEVDWPGLAAFFRHRRFVGYSYGPKISRGGVSLLGTTRGLRVGETVREARRFYGSAFHVSAAQGGSWLVRTPSGRIDGFLSDVTHPNSKILTIEAGDVGCPALTP